MSHSSEADEIEQIVEQILDWENGEMDFKAEVEFFQQLVESGLCWELQGMYGRRAKQLLDAGLIQEGDRRKRPSLITKPSTIDGVIVMNTSEPGEA